jgi:hypothetical protein
MPVRSIRPTPKERSRSGRDRGDDPFEGRRRGQDDLPGAEQSLGTSEDLGHRVTLLRQGLDLPFEPFQGVGLERADPEVLPDAAFVPDWCDGVVAR